MDHLVRMWRLAQQNNAGHYLAPFHVSIQGVADKIISKVTPQLVWALARCFCKFIPHAHEGPQVNAPNVS